MERRYKIRCWLLLLWLLLLLHALVAQHLISLLFLQLAVDLCNVDDVANTKWTVGALRRHVTMLIERQESPIGAPCT